MSDIKIWSWHNTPVAYLRHTSRRVDIGRSIKQRPDALARLIAADLRKLPEGERAMIWQGHLYMVVDMETDPARAYSPIGPDSSRFAGWCGDLLWALRRSGAEVDALWLDLEGAASMWWHGEGRPRRGDERAEYFRRIYAAREVLGDLPDVDPATLATPANRQVYQVLMNREHRIVETMLRCAIVEPLLALWPEARVSNYGDADPHPDWAVTERNGWRYSPRMVSGPGGTSSPNMYLSCNGSAYKGRKLDARWLRFVNLINLARACRANNSTLIPWISPPGYWVDTDNNEHWDGNAWLWQQILLHLVAMGVKDVLYWNPDNGKRDVAGDDLLCVYWIRRHSQRVERADGPLARLPDDATEVTTGKVTTRYEDFQAHMGGDGA